MTFEEDGNLPYLKFPKKYAGYAPRAQTASMGLCIRRLEVRVLSGAHDKEPATSVAFLPFVIDGATRFTPCGTREGG